MSGVCVPTGPEMHPLGEDLVLLVRCWAVAVAPAGAEVSGDFTNLKWNAGGSGSWRLTEGGGPALAAPLARGPVPKAQRRR